MGLKSTNAIPVDMFRLRVVGIDAGTGSQKTGGDQRSAVPIEIGGLAGPAAHAGAAAGE